jgi:hypothetical protein
MFFSGVICLNETLREGETTMDLAIFMKPRGDRKVAVIAVAL